MTTPFAAWQQVYTAELWERTVPFWLRHAVDHDHGGLFTCIDDTGQVLSTDKYLWSQTRALWVFSRLAQARPQPELRAVADGLYQFLARFGRTARGTWKYAVSRTGELLEADKSIYTDGFAIYGLSAYYELTGDAACRQLLEDTLDITRARLRQPGSYGIWPYTLPPGAQAQGIPMIFGLVFAEAAAALHREDLATEARRWQELILARFDPDARAIREFLTLDCQRLPGRIGACCLPGHACESVWAILRYGDPGHIPLAAEVLRWHLEKGWDPEYGGLYLALDLDGGEPYWPYADYKLWWPAVEALSATLLAYSLTREAWCLDWFTRIHDWAFAHYPVAAHGEWRNKLDRCGQPVTHTIALPVKDPFHLTRALLVCTNLLEDLA